MLHMPMCRHKLRSVQSMHEEEKVGVALLCWSVGWFFLFRCRCGLLNWTGPDMLGSISIQFASLHRGLDETHKHRYTQVLNKRVSDGTVPMFPGSYIPRVLCSPFFAIGEHRTPFIKKGPMFPFSSKRVLCSPGSMFPDILGPFLRRGT